MMQDWEPGACGHWWLSFSLPWVLSIADRVIFLSNFIPGIVYGKETLHSIISTPILGL